MPAILFDLDGTLADTLDDITFACNRSLSHFGLPPHDREAYRYFVGDGLRLLIERAVPADRQELVDAVQAHYMPYLVAHGSDRAKLYPGIAELLDGLTDRTIPFAVLSNKPHPSTLQVIENLAGRWTFAAVRGQVEGGPRKPDPGGALELAQLMHTDPADCYFVGDTRTDMETAVAAGMHPVGCLWGFRDRAELEQYGAKTIIAQPMELINVVCGM